MNLNRLLRIFPSRNEAYKLEKFYAQNIEQDSVQLDLIRDIRLGKVKFRLLGDAPIGIRENRCYSEFGFIKKWSETSIFKFTYLTIGKDIHTFTTLRHSKEIFQAIHDQIKNKKK